MNMRDKWNRQTNDHIQEWMSQDGRSKEEFLWKLLSLSMFFSLVSAFCSILVLIAIALRWL